MALRAAEQQADESNMASRRQFFRNIRRWTDVSHQHGLRREISSPETPELKTIDPIESGRRRIPHSPAPSPTLQACGPDRSADRPYRLSRPGDRYRGRQQAVKISKNKEVVDFAKDTCVIMKRENKSACAIALVKKLKVILKTTTQVARLTKAAAAEEPISWQTERAKSSTRPRRK